MLDSTIAHYKITAKLGQGGMGEVYRATDTKLNREVAIKVLPESFARDKERLARFEREAKMLASLNHPNIASIYGLENSDGKKALVLELVEGETLTERLRTGAMPIDEALDVCKQIAEALEAAHEKGIIHRDLKPGNIKVTPDGKVKVLDFGLAKAATVRTHSTASHSPKQGHSMDGVESVATTKVNSQSPTLTASHTRPGVILGTAAYMSPEQARAKAVDKRSDIWSFGCVLYECLTGECLFRGEDVTETLATVIKGDPQWTDLPADTPLIIQLLIRKCLVKDRKERLHDISDARVDLSKAITDPNWGTESNQTTSADLTKGISKGVLAAVAVITGLITLGLGWFLKPMAPIPAEPEPPEPRHVPFTIGRTNGPAIARGNRFTISPDGKKLVYAMNATGSNLRLLSLADGTDKDISGTEGGRNPFFSRNNQSVGFTSDNQLKTVSLSGGNPRTLVSSDFSGARGASWGTNAIVYTRSLSGGLWIIDSNGRESKVLTELKPDELTHHWPQWLPHGKRVLFTVGIPGNRSSANFRAEVVEVASGNRIVLKEGCTYARYVASGHLLYGIDGAHYAQEFDLGKMEVKGEPKLVLNGLRENRLGALQYAVSDEGTLVYVSQRRQGGSSRKFLWLDQQGNIEEASTQKGNFRNPALSPDNKTVALQVDGNIQLLELAINRLTPFTLEGTTNSNPIWTPDGQSIVFRSDRGSKFGIWRKRANFTDKAQLLFPEVDYLVTPRAFSKDGRILFGDALMRETSFDAWEHTLGQTNAAPKFILETGVNESWTMLSPDGDWLVYRSALQLYVKRYDDKGTPRPLTTEGGQFPRWSKKGDRILYDHERAIWSIAMVVEGGAMNPGTPEHIVNLPPSAGRSRWDIDSTEERFLVMRRDVDEEVQAQRLPGLTTVNIVFNWFTELNENVPVSRE